jgi:O-antigen ligase
MDSRPLAHAGLPASPAARPSALLSRGRLRPSRTLARADRLGAVFVASLAWLLFDLGRPYTPPGLPLVLTAVLFIDWALKREKQLGPRWIWWLVLLGVIASGVAFAANTFSAYFYTRLMGILFLGICLPLQGLLTSLRHVRWFLYALILIASYVGAWAATHGGFGPASSAGQDENYVAALMTIGAALAYFSFFTDKRLWFRILLGIAVCTFIAALVMAQNPSRGGFLALVAVALYCLWRSPKKVMGLSIIGAASAALLLLGGDNFWKEIDTTGDYESGTGDMRLELWKAGVRMWKANPVLGVGAGNFRWVIGDYQSEDQFQKFGRSLAGSVVAHSSHVEMLSELGSVGTLATIVLTLSTWTGLGKIRPPKHKPGEPPMHPDLVQLGHYADAVRCAILAVLVNGTFLSLFYYSHIWVLIAAGTALPYVHRRILQREAALAPNALTPVIVNNNAVASHAKSFARTRGLSPRRKA